MRKDLIAAINSKFLAIPVGAIFYFVLTSGGIFYLFRNWAYDDPYITYRYVKNIINGLGFVYNPGERVLSTTTPLFTLLLAALSPLWSNLPRLANLIGAMSVALGALLIYWLADILNEPLVGWAGLLLYPTSPLLVNCLGSETPLYIAFCLACFVFYWRSSYTLTAIFGALAVLTRPDGILVPVLLAADFLVRLRRLIPWKSVMIFSLLALPWLIFSWAYFGSPIPATLAAKQHQGLMAISQRFGAGFLTLIKAYYLSWHYGIQAGVACLGISYMILQSRRWLLFIAWPIVYFITFMLLGVTRYIWYYAPLLPGFVVLVGLGLMGSDWIIRRLLDKVHNPGSLTGRLPQLVIVTILLILGVFQFIGLKTIVQNRDPRFTIYKAVGNWLRAYTLPDASIGTLEVGIIGYYAERPIIDFAGLIQPEIASRLEYHTTYEDAANYAVIRFQPDYLVLPEGIFPDLQDSYAAQNCQIVQRFQGASYNYANNLVVYHCTKSR
jgi:Gpi18-like mannosyltransferase